MGNNRVMKNRLALALVVMLLATALYPFLIVSTWPATFTETLAVTSCESASSAAALSSVQEPVVRECPKCRMNPSSIINQTLIVNQAADLSKLVDSVNIKRNFTHMVRSNHLASHPIRMNYYGTYSVRIVYFINCKLNPNYPEWIRGQWASIYRVMRPELVTLHVIATSHNCKKETGLHQAVKDIQLNATNSGPKSRIQIKLECHDEEPFDTYEYYGIRKVYDLGLQYRSTEDVLVYFHAKGITHMEHYDHNPFYTQFLFDNLPRVLEVLDIFPEIEKLGRYSGREGFMFYNFYYVRASYVVKAEPPLIATPNRSRFYYESWLGYLDIGPFEGDAENGDMRPGHLYPNTAHGCYALAYEFGKSEHYNIGTWYHNGFDQHLVW